MRNFHLASAVLALVAVLLTAPVAGQTSQTERLRVLSELQGIVDQACQRATLSGSRTTFDVKAEAEVAAKGLSRLLADVRGTLGAGVENTKWAGIGQEHIAEAIKSGNDCVARLNEIFVPRVFPQPAAAEIQPGKVPYLVRNLGRVSWVQYIHKSVGSCLHFLSTFGATSNECVQAPERFFCHHWVLEGNVPYPECFWTSEDCEANYKRSKNAEQKRLSESLRARKEYNLGKFGTVLAPPGSDPSLSPLPQTVVRASCTGLPWADAARQYQAWSTSL